ncbi:MAG: hypothetical protein GF400_07390 [Candidatus Eisenbacteria bacterium]|nr:hypothetical protein [Candidatus Eisenbacteria bacterium]
MRWLALFVLSLLCMQATAGETRLTTNPSDDRSPAWSPDGTTIAFSSDRVAGIADIWLMDAGGEAVSIDRLTTNDDLWHDMDPCWYPDGSHLAFDLVDFTDWTNDIYAADSRGTDYGFYQLTYTHSAAYDHDPQCSRAGPSAIAFTSDRAGGEPDVWKMDSGGEWHWVHALTTHPAKDEMGSWAPAGNFIYFTSERSGGSCIWKMDSSGEAEGLWQITFSGLDSSPACSPDGTRLAFARAGLGIFVMDLGAGVENQVTDGAWDGSPTWSPDGQLLAFERLESNWDIWATDSTGASPVAKESWGRIKALFR